MSCSQPNHARGDTWIAPGTGNYPAHATPDTLTSPWLVVSNSPEQITSSLAVPANLYKNSVKLAAGSPRRIRFFIWHRNMVEDVPDIARYMILALSVTSGTAVMSDPRSESQIPHDDAGLKDAGICIAKAHLYGSMGKLPISGPITTSERIVASFLLSQTNWSACAVIEITFTASEDCSLLLRTAATTSLNPLLIGDWSTPVAAHDEHIRGTWPYSGGFCDSVITIEACDNEALPQFEIANHNGADVALFLSQPGDTFATPEGNNGLYGANMSYEFTVANKCPDDKQAYCFLRARNVGLEGKFWGAGIVVPFENRGIDKIRFQGIDPPILNCCSLNDGGGPITVPALTILPVSKVLRLAIGGAAELPVNFIGANHDIIT